MATKFNDVIVETSAGVRTIIGGGTGATTSGAARDNLVVDGSLDWVAFEHFMYGTQSPFAGQMTAVFPTGGLASAAVAGLQGVNVFRTSALTGPQSSSIAISPNNMPLDLAAVPRATFATRVNFNIFPTINSQADGAVFRAGFMSSRDSTSSTGVYFELINLIETGALTLRCVQRNGGSGYNMQIPVADLNTLFGTNFANLSTRWVDLRIEKLTTGVYQFFWSVAPPTSASGTPVGNFSFNSTIGRPTLGNKTGYGLHIAKSTGTNGYEVNVDYIYIRLQSTSDTVI